MNSLWKFYIMKVRDKHFKLFISEEELSSKVHQISDAINQDYEGKEPLFIGILNGAFMFAADLMKNIHIPSEITFIKVSSYKAMASSGNIKELVGLQENIFKRHIILVEDIVDTGKTLANLITQFKALGPQSIEVASLLHKPDAIIEPVEVKYVGFSIPNNFVVGYGLDYDGFGRNSRDIYQLDEEA